MRVACVGGGPAGLFFALLMRRAGDHRVDVFERSAPDATFGFGVVFSRLSLMRLRRTAPEVVTGILDGGARWEQVEVRRGGESLSTSGHGFAAVERREMLAMLRRHAEEAGVGLHYRTEADAASLLDRYDVVVAADGAGSRSRGAFPDGFGARVTPGGSRYAWFASDRVFEDMTFLFEDSPHGPVAAHAYPYSRDRCTFLVEMDGASWERAGFTDGHTRGADWTDERAMAFASEVFAGHLRGGRLHGNGSRWLRFPQVSAEHWHHKNLVGIGDAVHTAHFSMGSGTTLALEDAAELVRALTAGDVLDVPAALAAYEEVRRPVVAGVQESAWASRRLWEAPEGHRDASLRELTLRLLTRAGQLSVRQMQRLDRDFERTAGSGFTALPGAPVRDLAELDGSLVEVAAPGGGAQDAAVLVERVRALRRARPEAEVGLVVPAPAADGAAVRHLAELVAEVVCRAPVDIVLAAPRPDDTGAGRVAQMVLAEELRLRTGTRTGYACRPQELEHGWTHVQAGRVDEVWTTGA
ncbi:MULTISPECIES: FAD-dependent monooxygenase [unclassified Streptomyces]|uniref:FAD-dependent monooxygenase n=1 Tax=unclassified Streptomyces TaxID=2593676 RepID=UPI002238D905|nr:FAD-dependent monooxygenase [Streptomyces sp. SHP 1-2]MCW5253061.1 FAD-dependent monooxygenase [Streptomyces sp. SHP 1-2]